MLTSAPYSLEAERHESRRLDFPELSSVTHDTWLREPVQEVSKSRWPSDRLVRLGEADFVLLLASTRLAGGVAVIAQRYKKIWWPQVLVAEPMYFRTDSLPAFTEAESRPNLDRLALAVGTDGDGLIALISEFYDATENGTSGIPGLGYRRLTGLGRLGKRP